MVSFAGWVEVSQTCGSTFGNYPCSAENVSEALDLSHISRPEESAI